MEQTNVPVVAKKIGNIVRVMFYMLRKRIISKRKLMVDLNLMMKRGKIVSKSLHNLVFPFHRSTPYSVTGHVSTSQSEYEFNCSNKSPTMFFKRKNNRHLHFFACAHASNVDNDVETVNEVRNAFEITNADVASPTFQADANLASPAIWFDADMASSPAFWANADLTSPALAGFSLTPARVRQMRITNSLSPLHDVYEDCHVDEAAEEFIARFYKQLKGQN